MCVKPSPAAKRDKIQLMDALDIRLKYRLEPIIGGLLSHPEFPETFAVNARSNPFWLREQVEEFAAARPDLIAKFRRDD